MNKGYNVILKIAGICILAGIVITIIFASTAGDRIYHDGNWDISFSNGNYEYENIDMTFDNTDDIENIDISIPYGDVKIIEGDTGPFVAMPSRRNAVGDYRDIVHPINQETRDMFNEVIIAEYEKAEDVKSDSEEVATEEE